MAGIHGAQASSSNNANKVATTSMHASTPETISQGIHGQNPDYLQRSTHNLSTESRSLQYAFVSHESAVDAIWHLAARNWSGVLDDENVWMVPAPDWCIKNQREVKKLAQVANLSQFGLSRRPIDLLVPDKSCYSRGKQARFHVWKDSFPDRSFVRIHERIFVSTPYFIVLQLAMSRRSDRLSRLEAEISAAEDRRIRKELGIDTGGSSYRDLLKWNNISHFVRATQVLCDFMGTYRYRPYYVSDGSFAYEVMYHTKPLITEKAMSDYLVYMRKTRGIQRARRVASAAFSGAASPMETALALILCLPVEAGGFGLPRPQLNWEISPKPQERELVSQKNFFADLCWPDHRVIVEYYGQEDHFESGFQKISEDMTRTNSLNALGWSVLQVTHAHIRTANSLTLLANQLASLLGAQTRVPSDLERIWRTRLIAQLLPRSQRM